MTRTNASSAAGALENIAYLRQHLTVGSLDLQVVFDAVCLRLAAAIEDASHISPEVRAEVFGDQWGLMWATRNRVAHAYLDIDYMVIGTTIERDLDAFEAGLRLLADGAPA